MVGIAVKQKAQGRGTSILSRTIGSRIRELRKVAGLTQVEVAARTSGLLPQKRISELESGVRGAEIMAWHLDVIARALGVTPRNLLPDGEDGLSPAESRILGAYRAGGVEGLLGYLGRLVVERRDPPPSRSPGRLPRALRRCGTS